MSAVLLVVVQTLRIDGPARALRLWVCSNTVATVAAFVATVVGR